MTKETAAPSNILIAFPIAISLLFACTLFYNGVAHSLHWLSLAGIVLLIWLSTSIAKLDVAPARLVSAWLPATALAYAVWLLVNPFISTYPYVSSATAMQLALLPLVFVGWSTLPAEQRHSTWRLIWPLLLLFGAVLAVWGIGDYFLLHVRSHGPLIDANAYAALINLLLIPAAFAFMRAAPPGKGFDDPRLLLGLVGLFALALSTSLSRGGLISLLAVLPFVLWLNRRFPAFRGRAAMLLGVIALAYLIPKATPLGANMGVESLLMAPAQQVEQDSSIQARFLMWKATWQIFEKSNPWIGTGLGTYKNYYATYRDTRETMSSGNLAHNDYLQALQEGGMIHLALLLALTVLAPASLLYRSLRDEPNREPSDTTDISAGLLLGIMAISLHALVNFTHYVAPIAVLTGLYLARAWETKGAHRSTSRPLPFIAQHVKPAFLKALVIALLAVPVTVLAVDGVIFKLFATGNPLIAKLEPRKQFTVVNTALAIRPGNPRPRIFLIRHLLDGAITTGLPELRQRLLAQAEAEAHALIDTAPGLASGRYFLGKVRAIRGTPEALLLAREDFERAVQLVPASTGMRLELVRLYQALGMEREAHETIREAKKWYIHEADYVSLAAFAREAQAVARRQQDSDEAEFWAWVYDRLAQLELAG